ncbi:tetraacyldisaccharide 4'-kinase [Rhodoferax sp. TS-BS-61-7]|uniref:tetraacyldisaccharide 4'-kinase n=1 Tax=Rhodoferax sp. TS-BS-61-7 TaxID=2094194 RepID=UPI000CF6C47B|nr:tetraacyldisaccharide 4'-kinase [Rhodoferax sp. TS-BS-61-7]PQA78044.1 tetraacyldisaccharide 4'-kinase [Rhodoferax sp. TS-BS-61-7]
MHSGLQQAFLQAWTGRSALAWALRPIAFFYGVLIALRRGLYHQQWLAIQRLPVPVVVVGNVLAGGAGKTPTVIGVVAHLQAQDWQVGIVSRGYGRQGEAVQAVHADASPTEVGDEPLLLQRRTGVPVYVGRQRAAAARALLQDHPHTQIIVCDDGMQHYALYRDVEICVFDSRGAGNGWLLPAGPLREPWPPRALKAAGQSHDNLLVLNTGPNAVPGFTATRQLADHTVGASGDVQPLTALNAPDTHPVCAVAGIAQPEVFFAMLRAQGVLLAHTIALPDHYDFDSWSRNTHEVYTLICTEKDAAKLWQHAPEARAVPLVQTAPPDFYAALDRCLQPHRPAPVSSPHGHPTS